MAETHSIFKTIASGFRNLIDWIAKGSRSQGACLS
jgi:hypothetical protein